MSLTSYRAAPPRANGFSLLDQLFAGLQEIYRTAKKPARARRRPQAFVGADSTAARGCEFAANEALRSSDECAPYHPSQIRLAIGLCQQQDAWIEASVMD